MEQFRHKYHKNEQKHHENRIQTDRDIFSQQSKKRRHKTAADVGKRHLDTDDSLAEISSKVSRGLMDNGRIDRSASKPDEDQTGKEQSVPSR